MLFVHKLSGRRHVFGRAIRLHHERTTVTPETFAHRRRLIECAAERLIFGPPLGRGEAWKLQRRYQREWQSLLVFLQRDDVEPTNNSSERDIRNPPTADDPPEGHRWLPLRLGR